MLQIKLGIPDENKLSELEYPTLHESVDFTMRLFGYAKPYERFVNIFGDVSYEWDKNFINMMVNTLETGVYDNGFNPDEFILAEEYVEYKYGSGTTPSEVVLLLDTYLGAL